MSAVRKTAKWAGILFLPLITLIGLLLVDRYGAARRSVDTHEGTLQLAGLTAPVQIIRDRSEERRVGKECRTSGSACP